MKSNSELSGLNIYQLARELNKAAWGIYKSLHFEIRIAAGRQFIRAIDSVGANIAEGYGRFHYKDKLRFYYNARGSLLESQYWFDLLTERELIPEEAPTNLKEDLAQLYHSLNSFIKYQKSLIT